MAEPGEHRDRGLFHLHNKDKQDEVVVQSTQVHSSATVVHGKPVDAKAEIKKHAHKEHLAEAGAMLGGAVAMYEKHQAKKDPENAHKHHFVETVAGAVAVGSGALAKHEHHDKKAAEKEGKHGLFGHHH